MRRTLCILTLGLSLVVWAYWSVRQPGAEAGSPSVATGDVNADGMVNLGDPIYLLDYLFNGGPTPAEIPCPTGFGDIQTGAAQLLDRTLTDMQAFVGSAMQLDTETVQVCALSRGLYAEAMRTDLADLEGPGDFFSGVDTGVVYIGFSIPGPAGAPVLSAGYYRLHLLFDPAIYSTGDPNFARSFLVDSSGNQFELPTQTAHFPGTSPISQLGVRSEICQEGTQLKGRRYVSCPQLGDLLAMTCIESTILTSF